MDRKAVSAVFLAVIMLSGCIGTDENSENEAISEEPTKFDGDIKITSEVGHHLSRYVGDVVFVEIEVSVEPKNTQYAIERLFSVEGNEKKEVESTITSSGDVHKIIFMPDEPGTWEIRLRLIIPDAEIANLSEIRETFEILPPNEGPTILSVDSIIELEQSMPVTISGEVIHSTPESCVITDDEIRIVEVNSDGEFDLDLGLIEDSSNLTILAICGVWTQTYDSRLVRIIIASSDDSDGDGIPDVADSCPNGYGEDEGWNPNEVTDKDGDGCHDFEEDLDDDNDLIPDIDDDCSSVIGWISDSDNDYDRDGCADSTEDNDDDNDGIEDDADNCPKGEIGWDSKPYTDWDVDGCEDYTEDFDDDNDMVNDTVDDCWRGISNWISDTNTDYDGDGCFDATEDTDDDNDGINDVNATGITLDECPRTPLDAVDVNEKGCDATERDSDSDGIVDSDDECPGTPGGNMVNSVGCADIDGDGVYSNVDACQDTKSKWTVDSSGCAVYQLPVAWKENGHGSGRMDTVAHFSVPTLDGTWSFRNEWTGEDVYIFLFKYTDTSGNGNNADWSKNPGSMIRQLPDNAHLFYGSFDNSYRSDVQNRKAAVQNALNADEELKWKDRIHYIDQDMSTASGGLGDLISNWNTFYYGIDRFQRAREIGSIYAWTSQTNDITHWAYEARMYNYEYPTELRETDPNVHTVTISDNLWHNGGWGGGYSSTYENVTINLPDNISSYDTLEVFHEHACEDRRNRYQKSDGSYGGCHEWDYLAYMKICDQNDSSKCGTEFMRWITTYGREGRWITDISPYLFMLEENDTRNFRYQGANKGFMTIKLLFSNWDIGERSISGEQVFTGGQFAGEYNNETTYKRQHNFSAIPDYYSVKIVATITGHGFNQDQANCAEFCDHEHHYYLNGNTAYEWHPIVYDSQGCEKEVDEGVVANQYGSWPFGRAGWCAGQDVKQWVYDITDWVDNSTENNLRYRGLYNGQEYIPQDTNGGGREIRANVWLVWYDQN